MEQCLVHGPRIDYSWVEWQKIENFLFDIDAGGELDQFKPIFSEREDTALGHVNDASPFSTGSAPGERDLTNSLYEFGVPALFQNSELSLERGVRSGVPLRHPERVE